MIYFVCYGLNDNEMQIQYIYRISFEPFWTFSEFIYHSVIGDLTEAVHGGGREREFCFFVMNTYRAMYRFMGNYFGVY